MRLKTTLPLLALAYACTPAATTVATAPVPGAPAQARPVSAPAPLAPRPLEFPAHRTLRLANGLEVIVVEHTGQPVANANLYVRAGAAREAVERAGLAGMTAELLTKGTTTRSASDIATAIENVGGQLSASATNDWLVVSASVLNEHLPLAMELLSDVALRPTFPADELTVTRRRMLSALQAQLGQPGVIAQREFLRAIYGPAHPYGRSPVPGTIEGITRDDMVRFHTQHFAPGNALLVVSGAVTANSVDQLARTHFGGWTGAAAAVAALPQPPAVAETRIALVHRPGSVQSNIRIGHLAIRPDNPDFFPLLVLDNIIGGGNDARLFQILREEKGWTYGAYTQLTRPADIGYFAAQAEVRTEVTDSALVEMLNQLRRIRDETVPMDEFEGARGFLAGSFPLRIETAGQIAGQIAQARLLGLPVEDLTRYRERILAVTPADVQRVARQYVQPDRAAIIIVGDAARVLPLVEGIAPVAVYDVAGQPVARDALVARAAAEAFDGTRLEPGTRTYSLMVQDNPMGTATYRLARDGEDWVATTTLQSPIMSQDAEARFRVADLSAVSSSVSMAQGPMRVSAELRHDAGRVTGRLELPPEAGGARDVDVEVPAGTLLPGMEDYVIAAARIEAGRTVTLPVFDLITGSVTNMTARVTGEEGITVPAGTFDTWRVEVSTGAQVMTYFVRRDAPHILIRQEFPGAPVALVLQSMQ